MRSVATKAACSLIKFLRLDPGNKLFLSKMTKKLRFAIPHILDISLSQFLFKRGTSFTILSTLYHFRTELLHMQYLNKIKENSQLMAFRVQN